MSTLPAASNPALPPAPPEIKEVPRPKPSSNMNAFAARPVTCFEKLNRLGEGTYGTVYRARDKETGEIVALKKLRLSKEKGGFPLTSVREIKILKSLRHPNIVTLKEISVGRKPDSIFLVFEYCENDFGSLLDRIPRPFSEAEVKTIMLQLLNAVHHLHKNFILHRDLKLSNLLMNRKGALKLADLGLARYFSNPLQCYTPKVVTLWYRAPELLLNSDTYHTAVDMWAVGCIFGELLKHKPLMPGKTEIGQLQLIFELLGTPNDKIWPGYSKLDIDMVAGLKHYPYNNISQEFGKYSDSCIDLLQQLLTYDPSKRLTAEKALQHPYFTEKPLPISLSMMPTFPSLSEQSAASQFSHTSQSIILSSSFSSSASSANANRTRVKIKATPSATAKTLASSSSSGSGSGTTAAVVPGASLLGDTYLKVKKRKTPAI